MGIVHEMPWLRRSVQNQKQLRKTSRLGLMTCSSGITAAGRDRLQARKAEAGPGSTLTGGEDVVEGG